MTLLATLRKYRVPGFIILLAAVCFYYNYQEIVFKRPQSTHKWRQSDCASVTLNYYQGGMKFLEPQVHNLTSDGGASGKCATSEVPLLYYGLAMLYKVTGPSDAVYRMVNTLIFLLGMVFLFRLFYLELNSFFWAAGLSLFLFTAPLLVYYGNNFLTDTSALSMSFVSWYYFLSFLRHEKRRHFYRSMLFIGLAGAFKVTAFLSLFAFMGVIFLSILFRKNRMSEHALFPFTSLHILLLLIPLFVVGVWLFYADYYNACHDCTYFSTTIFPFWELDGETIASVFGNIKELWFPHYFHASAFVFLLLATGVCVVGFREGSLLLQGAVILLLIQAVVYVLLQFWTFNDHDYYTINLYIIPAAIMLSAFSILRRKYTAIFNSRIFRGVFLLFLIFNGTYAKEKLHERYHSWMNDYESNQDIYTATPYLRAIGIQPTDTVISIPDGSHASLYLMNVKGWTEYTDARFNRGEKIRYNQDSAGIQQSIDRGAKYLVVNGAEELFKKPYLASYARHLIGRYKSVLIFRLNDTVYNFNVADRQVMTVYHCDAETRSPDGEHYVDTVSGKRFEYGITQTREEAWSGEYAARLDEKNPYAFTVRIVDLKYGESLAISGRRKGAAQLIATSAKEGLLYDSSIQILSLDKETKWEHVTKEIFISDRLEGEELLIYVYSDSDEPSYFDDFEIVRYKSIVQPKK